MSNTVAIRYKSYLPGSGFDSNGNPKQGKQQVVGVITVTSYAAGESLPPSKIGLTTIDDLALHVQTAVGAANGQPRIALYDYGSQEFYVFTDNDGADPAGDNLTVRFTAFGDSALDAEFL